MCISKNVFSFRFYRLWIRPFLRVTFSKKKSVLDTSYLNLSGLIALGIVNRISIVLVEEYNINYVQFVL